MKNILLLLLLGFCFAGCNEDEVQTTASATSLEIVTGIFLRDVNGQPLGKLGNPNVKQDGTSFSPNPAEGQVFIFSDTAISTVWIVPANKNTNFPNENFSVLLENVQYEEAELNSKSIRSFTTNGSTIFALRIDDFPTGYYRIFYLLENGNLLWDNIYIYKDEPFSDILNRLNDDWD